MKGFVIICILLLCLEAKSQKADSGIKYGLSDQLISDWKKDKNGCLMLRCKYWDSVCENRSLVGTTRKRFIKLFGKPDDYRATRDILVYTVCTECDKKGRSLKETDSAWIVIYFTDGKLEKCTMEIQ